MILKFTEKTNFRLFILSGLLMETSMLGCIVSMVTNRHGIGAVLFSFSLIFLIGVILFGDPNGPD